MKKLFLIIPIVGLMILTGCPSDTPVEEAISTIDVTFGETSMTELFHTNQILYHIDKESRTVYGKEGAIKSDAMC